MEAALQDGARRRSIAALATPVPMKRSLKASPVGPSTGSTVTPDAKRHMAGSADTTSAKSTSTASSTVAPVTTMPPVELFPAAHDDNEQPIDVDDAEIEDTQIDGSPAGWVCIYIYIYIIYIYIIYIYILYIYIIWMVCCKCLYCVVWWY